MRRDSVLRVVIVINLVGLSALVLFVFDVQSRLPEALHWIHHHIWAGAAAYVAIYAVATVIVVPASLFQVASGAIFDAPLGMLVSLLGCTIGMVTTFLVARYLLREWVSQWVETKPHWLALEDALEAQGWSLVLLLRVAPFVPCCVLNYSLPLTSIRLWTYTWASTLGIIPMGMLFVYLGSMGRDLADIVSGRSQVPPTWIVWMTVSTVIMVAAAAAILGHYMRIAITARLQLNKESLEAGEAEEGRLEAEGEEILINAGEDKNESGFGSNAGVSRSADLRDPDSLTQPLIG